jgi:beta-glucosidase
VLPVSKDATVAVIGPLADAPSDQLGTWSFDGKSEFSQTPIMALQDMLKAEQINYVKTLDY